MTGIPVEHHSWFSILPAALAIILAIKTRRVIESALCGIGLGAAIIDYHSNGFIHSVCYCIPNALMALAGHAATSTLKGIGLTKDPSRAQLFIGVLLLGAFITVIEKSGGCQAFAQRSTKHIRGERGALLTCMALGLSIFTSAFFGILVPGTAMKPIFDRLKISREKLAYYIDSTSAPTKALIPVSGWVAFMMQQIEENVPSIKAGEGFVGFLRTMRFNFYCWAVIGFTLLLSLQMIPDFGPMKEAERRVKKDGFLHKPGSTPMIDPKIEERAMHHVRNGGLSDMVVPLVISTLVMFALGMWDGPIVRRYPSLSKTGVESMTGMSMAFAVGLLVAMIQYASKKLMTVREFLEFAMEGAKSPIIGAIMILVAVTLADLMRASVPEGLGTAAFIVQISKPYLAHAWIPALTFLVSALLSFSMGTSWGVWAMMMPISVPLAMAAGMNPFVTAGAVLSGGAFGDHCSPISDTAVLSSLAANTDHLEHIRTQLPYALVTAAFAFLGYIFLGYFTYI